jgi:hypothetical protein
MILTTSAPTSSPAKCLYTPEPITSYRTFKTQASTHLLCRKRSLYRPSSLLQQDHDSSSPFVFVFRCSVICNGGIPNVCLRCRYSRSLCWCISFGKHSCCGRCRKTVSTVRIPKSHKLLFARGKPKPLRKVLLLSNCNLLQTRHPRSSKTPKLQTSTLRHKHLCFLCSSCNT